MLFKIDKNTTVKTRVGDDELPNSFNVLYVGYDDQKIYFSAFGDTDLFKTDNPAAEEIADIPKGIKFFTSGKFKGISSYNDFLKNTTREKIETKVGDVYDLLADLSKRICMMERLVMRTMFFYYSGTPLPQELKDKYLPMITQYVQMVDAGLARDRTDLEDPAEVFAGLIGKNNEITDLVEKEYFDKK